ncbi:methionine biosynthesis protein MetW [Xanthomonas campestris]|uniref:methionine biosynthesis protein MetW n=1 Tax=Xanthomonas TaxID=338 RepID=UPI001E5D9F10|nr:methionine biosynthesis protein MetW [Xanthomonas campestris]MCC5088265.1 methionine biosynthesis protein MetW [Xanthomonas campestris]
MADFDERYTSYQTDRAPLRKLVRKLYLRSAQSLLRGPTLDFGCGVGELLGRLPEGSMGLEYNGATVAYCRSRGLAVDHYDGFADDWQLRVVPDSVRFESMVVSHVLEHLEAPAEIFGKLARAARRLGVQRLLVIVPGKAGFRSDPTHLTFIDNGFLSRPDLLTGTGFRLEMSRYFPLDQRWLGDWLTHHEMQTLYVRDIEGADPAREVEPGC